MNSSPTPGDFTILATILDANRGKPLSEEHLAKVRKAAIENGKRFEAEEKALAPTDEMMKRRFTI